MRNTLFGRLGLNHFAGLLAFACLVAGMLSPSLATAGTPYDVALAVATAGNTHYAMPDAAAAPVAISATVAHRSGWRQPVPLSTMAIEGLRVGNTWYPPRGPGERGPNGDGIALALARQQR